LKRGFLVEESSGRRVAVRGRVTIGRTHDCEFIIEDGAASRRHVEVAPRDEGFVWKDLGSTNGTLLNGRAMLAGELRAGDMIQIGDTAIRFVVEGDTSSQPALSQGNEPAYFAETLFDSPSVEHRVSGSSKPVELLSAVYAVANELAADYDRDSLMERVLTLVMRAINAQRGAIFLTMENGELDPSPVSVRVSGRASRDGIRISQTIAAKVLREGRSVLYTENDDAGEMEATESILSLDLRSIVCVPLRAKDRILGILYIDSNVQGQEYGEDDVLLAAAVGNSAGLALDNARMALEMLDKQRIEQDLQTAWTIQEGFLVKDWPEGGRQYQVYGETRPAKTVGGDFYDYVHPAPGKVGILIGDVSGKGVPASLMMAQLLASFRLLARDHESPGQVLRMLNTDLAKRSRRGMFCTLLYLSLNLRTGEVRVANAGHHPVLCIGPNGTRELGAASGPPAGVLPTGEWEESVDTVQPGDTLLLYTDGIVEAQSMGTLHENKSPNESIEQYEIENLSVVARAHHAPAPHVLLDAIFNDVIRFCAPGAPHDDCTMIALKYLGPNA
jgi:serine phosphatase RsbU (regulator of sigma subunit)